MGLESVWEAFVVRDSGRGANGASRGQRMANRGY